jgi:hypothetical protein
MTLVNCTIPVTVVTWSNISPDARLLEHHDADESWFLGDVPWVLGRFAEFIRERADQRVAPRRRWA